MNPQANGSTTSEWKLALAHSIIVIVGAILAAVHPGAHLPGYAEGYVLAAISAVAPAALAWIGSHYGAGRVAIKVATITSAGGMAPILGVTGSGAVVPAAHYSFTPHEGDTAP